MFLKMRTGDTMNQNYNERPNGYLESISKGIQTVRSFSGRFTRGKGTKEERRGRLAEELRSADAVVIGAGAGLSASAGLTYSGERFDRYFGDFAAKFGIRDMYGVLPVKRTVNN
jgi:NAD-dependent SIR2 family protein deacetylase